MPEIHQVLADARPGDAVTDAALALRDLLRRVGPSDVFARNVDAPMAGEVRPLWDYQRRRGGAGGTDVLVHHAAAGHRDVLTFLLQRPERLVLVSHAPPPASYLRPWDPEAARRLDDGRLALVALRPRVARAVAPTRHHAAELARLGYRDVAVVPPILDPIRLLAVAPQESTMVHFAEGVGGPMVLFAGEVLPHERPDLLLQVAHILGSYHLPEVQLVVAGPAACTPYRDALVRYQHRLNLPNVWFTGSVPDEQLAAFYRSADVFLTLSEHETVPAPLVEALAFDVPVVARRHGGIPETLGRAGLLLPAGAGVELVVEALLEMVAAPDRRARVAAIGRRRLAHLHPDRARAALLRVLTEVV